MPWSLVLATLVSLIATQVAMGAAISDEEELATFGGVGEATGKLNLPLGLATDPTTGHVYVSDFGNNRISEFTAWGGFVKAFGFDVAPGAVNEQQEVRLQASAGEFRLKFKGEQTAELQWGAEAEEVKAALNALPSIGAGGVEVQERAGVLDGTVPIVYVVNFKGPALEGENQPQLEAVSGTPPLSGGVPSTSLLVRTQADGHPTTTGLEACTAESGCKAGVKGGGTGQFSEPSGIAVDAEGDVFVREVPNHRVQEFDSAGRFVRQFGSEGTGDGQFGKSGGGVLALCPPGPLCPSGALFAGDGFRVERFGLSGEYESQFEVGAGNLQGIAFDPASEDVYATFGEKQGVHKFNPATGEEGPVSEGLAKLKGPGAIATDSAGNLFARDQENEVLEFDASGNSLSPPTCCKAIPPLRLAGLATNAIGDLYVAYSQNGVDSLVRSFGPAPAFFEAPPPVPPEITAQFSNSVQRDGASVGALINPRFWSDTRYSVQYGTGKCSEGGCSEEVPLAPGKLLTSKVFGASLKAAVDLEDLEPGTTYHYRFVAQSGGGGPVYGIDPDGEAGPEEASAEAGLEATFTTYEPLPPKACSNQAFRTSLAQRLPDCRAYEMVSPLDKNSGDIAAILDITGYTTALDQSAAEGGKLTYTSYRSFGAPKGAAYVNQYIASRDPQGGWSTEAINPSQTPIGVLGQNLENPYKAFSEDLCQSWLVLKAEPLLAPGAVPGFPELYRREGCGGKEIFETLSAGEVEPSANERFFNPELQGTAADERTALVRVEDKLTPEATAGVYQTYLASEGGLKLICFLPSGAPTAGNCSGGTGVETGAGLASLHRTTSVKHAISEDGSKAYWTDSGPTAQGENNSGPGTIYLRENPAAEQSAEALGGAVGVGELNESSKLVTKLSTTSGAFAVGQNIAGKGIRAGTTIVAATANTLTLSKGAAESNKEAPLEGFSACTESEKSCTVPVSETQTDRASVFLGASADGSKALFEIDDKNQQNPTSKNHNLYEFTVGASSSLVAGKSLGVVATSEDLSRIYFASEEALAGPNGEGKEPSVGKPNLYLDEEGTKSFIATLSKEDVKDQILSDTEAKPVFHPARATADGTVLAFISTARPTGYDNTDLLSGKADSEIYRYEVGAPGPVCISCNPGGARPLGIDLKAKAEVGTSLWGAALLPPGATDLYVPRALSADGKRLFFDSFDALLPRDTNGTEDVYEWESAPSQQACEEAGAEVYVESAEGCLSLISGGTSPQDSEFLDASATGDDVFFATGASLLARDPGLIDVYDARVGGGIDEPPPSPECQGESCRAQVSPPTELTPSSSTYSGPEDLKEKPKKKHHKGKHHKKQKRHHGRGTGR